MERINFKYLSMIAGRRAISLEEIFEDKRLCKHLWIEFILNPDMVEASKTYLKKPLVKEQLSKALSWYFAFRWLFKENHAMEALRKKETLTLYPIKGEVYRRERRSFLKGLIYARLC